MSDGLIGGFKRTVDSHPCDFQFARNASLAFACGDTPSDFVTINVFLLAHVSPLGWEHINLTGEYRWLKP
ncbi:hypothetical protein [Acetobacter oryzoeni]